MELQAGAGIADITPELGIQLAGDIGSRRWAEEIKGRCYARALILKQSGKVCCLLSLDVMGVMRKYASKLQQQIAAMLGTTPGAVIVHAMQSHSAPIIGNHLISDECGLIPAGLDWLRGGDMRYIEPFFKGTLEAVEKARNSMQEVTVKAGRTMDGRVAFNRRFILRDGTVKTNPKSSDIPNILQTEGPVDPEAGVAVFEHSSHLPVAALLHHTCHPVHGYPRRWVSPDWMGIWARNVQEILGNNSVALVMNGACGNIQHHNYLDPDQEDTIELMGKKLTESSERILPNLQQLGNGPLLFQHEILSIPMRALAQENIARARALIEKHPEPVWLNAEKTSVDWDWVYAAATLDLLERQRRNPDYDYEIQAIRIGDLALVAWPGEPFVEAQLAVKKASPAAYTFVAHFCGDSAGYIPTKEAMRRGGYETRTANWSKLAPEALEMITEKTMEMMKQLWRNS